MSHRWLALTLTFVALSPISAPHLASAAPAAQGTVDVAERDFSFDPATVTVAAGTAVRWTNRGGAPHTATADDGSWDSGTTSPGATFAFTFAVPGTYRYFCRFHQSLGMAGTVVVTGVGSGAESPAPTTAPPAAPPAVPSEEGAAEKPVVQPPLLVERGVYLVRPGDTLSGIAARFGVPLIGLVRANRVRNADLIYAGSRLVIPRNVGGAPAPRRAACQVYVVHRGDTVFVLALRFQTTVHAIAAANGIRPDLIYAGQRLLICPPQR